MQLIYIISDVKIIGLLGAAMAGRPTFGKETNGNYAKTSTTDPTDQIDTTTSSTSTTSTCFY